MSDKWCYSFDRLGYAGTFNSREEAINEATFEAKRLNQNIFYIGRAIYETPKGIDIDILLENIAEDTIDNSEVGYEYGADYLDDVKEEHKAELEKILNSALFSWMDKHNYNPHWYMAVDIEEVYLGGE